MDDGAAVARAGRGIDRIERLQAQNVAGVDRVGIAQPVLDGSDRQLAGPRGARRLGCRTLGVPHLGRRIERAREGEVAFTARDDTFPAFAGERGNSLHKARGDGRAAGHLGRARKDDFTCAQCLREVVRGEADAALGRIEAEIAAHRAAQPRVVARLRRPGTLVQPAQHDAVDRLQARLQRAVDMRAQLAAFRTTHHAVANGGLEQLGVVPARDREICGSRAVDKLLESIGKHRAVVIGEGGGLTVFVGAEGRDYVVVTLREFSEGFATGFQCFERCQRGSDFFDQRSRGVEFVIADRFARIAWVQIVTRRAESFERMRQGLCSGARTRPTQQRSF